MSLFHSSEDVIHVLFLDVEKIRGDSDTILRIEREKKETEYNIQFYLTHFPYKRRVNKNCAP